MLGTGSDLSFTQSFIFYFCDSLLHLKLCFPSSNFSTFRQKNLKKMQFGAGFFPGNRQNNPQLHVADKWASYISRICGVTVVRMPAVSVFKSFYGLNILRVQGCRCWTNYQLFLLLFHFSYYCQAACAAIRLRYCMRKSQKLTLFVLV